MTMLFFCEMTVMRALVARRVRRDNTKKYKL